MSLTDRKLYTILDAKATTGIGNTINTTGFANAVISVATTGSANLTMKAQGAIGDVPDFSSAQSVTNMWDYIQLIDLNNGVPINGDTGFSVTGTDDYRLFSINVEQLDYINMSVTARSAGSVTVKVILTNNQ